MYGLYLGAQLVGHRGTMRLVLGIDIAAKGFALGIEYDGNIAVLIVFYETAYHIDDTLDCSGRLPLTAH
jgi:hypothetical protein